MVMNIQLFPEEIIELNRELATGLHPKLEESLQEFGADDIVSKLAHIATYCKVVVDGMYDGEGIAVLAGVLAERLKERRENPHGTIYLN